MSATPYGPDTECVLLSFFRSNSGSTATVAHNSSKRGYGVVFFAVSLTALFGALGLAYDLGRMFILKSELQAYADATALAAIYEMDGTKAGVQGANSIVTNGTIGTRTAAGYYFNSKTITGAT